jgi:uncharacterized protein YbjQ (UPF0145 family)
VASPGGIGTPWSVSRRRERASDSRATTSLLSVAGQAGLGLLGFAQIGDVGAACVTRTGPIPYYGRCAQRDTQGRWIEELRVITHRADRGFTSWGNRIFENRSFDDRVARYRRGWDTALGRLMAECAALGGDGVVGVHFVEQRSGQHVRELTVLGTAVRYLGSTHLQEPFSTTLSGCDIAKLVGAGFFPVRVIVAIAVGLRHNDYDTVRARRSLLTNLEVPAHTELLNATKRAARDDMARRAAALGADGAIADGQFAVDVLECECDYAAEVKLIGNALVRFGQSSPVGTLKATVDMAASRKTGTARFSQALNGPTPPDIGRPHGADYPGLR